MRDSKLTRSRALGTRELKRGLDFFKCHSAIIVIRHYSIIWYMISARECTASCHTSHVTKLIM